MIILSAPTMPPTIFEAYGLGTTSIQFCLSPPRPYYAAYEVTGYKIRYRKLGQTSNSFPYKTMKFPPESVTANLTGLDTYESYCLSAQAVTSYGPGVFGPCTNVTTSESGNLISHFSDNVLVLESSF